MTVEAIAVLYGAVGLGAALALWVRGPRRPLDAGLLLLFWPLYGPFVLGRPAAGWPGEAGADGSPIVTALRRAAASPLGALLPDEETARALAVRLEHARRRIEDLEEILGRPGFDEEGARARLEELRGRGASEAAVSSARLRLHNIRRLRELKNRTERELDEVGELLDQLTTHAEVVRLVGSADPTTEELVQELVSRVEGLEQMLADENP